MAKPRLFPCDTANRDNDDSDQSEDTEALLSDSIQHETEGHDNNGCIENVEAIH